MARNVSIIRPLGQIAALITQQSPSDTIRGIDQSALFGPLQLVRPLAPPDAQPRGWQYNPGQNQVITPRAAAQYSFEELRDLALYPLARLCIENCKDVICSIPKQIRAIKLQGETNKQVDARSKGDANLKMLNDFFDRPDLEHDWDSWLRPFLEDVYVIDALSIVVRRARSGKLIELRVVDGSKIKRAIDEQGYTPLPPNPAYQQNWFGFPAVNLTTDQLVYRPRNIVPRNWVESYLYGMSPTEQMADEIKIGIERLAFVYAYYREGSIPDGMHVVPPKVHKDIIKETQQFYDSNLGGNLGKRRKLELIQGFTDDGKDQILFPKQVLLADIFDDYHIAKIAYGYGASKQRLVKQLNRASAQQDQETAEEEGTEPMARFVKCTIDFIIKSIFQLPGYELTYDQKKELDPVKRAQVAKSNVDSGIHTRNEEREVDGLDANPAPEADMLMITTAGGAAPLNADEAAKRTQALAEAKPDDSGDPDSKGNGAQSGSRKKKAQRITFLKRREARIDPGFSNHDTIAAKSRLETACLRVFQRQKEKAAQEANQLLKWHHMKADDPDRAKKIADEIYQAIEAEFASLPADARAALEQAAMAGINDAIISLEVRNAEFISSVNTIASAYAEKRAAEMVGMKYNDEGELIDNPNADMAISDTTRDEIRRIVTQGFEEGTPYSEIVEQIRDSGAFSDARAALIARTETSNAMVRGQFDVWRKSGLVEKVKWIAAGPDPCETCLGNDGVVVEFGKEFPSGDLMPLAHPNCYCFLSPVQIKGLSE